MSSKSNQSTCSKVEMALLFWGSGRIECPLQPKLAASIAQQLGSTMRHE